MRLWSISPIYLDTKGLVALWREALLAKAVLMGKTQGYVHHPQLVRFRELVDPVAGINFYLSDVYREAVERGYNFDKTKIVEVGPVDMIGVNDGQIQYEFNHLMTKLTSRDVIRYKKYCDTTHILLHPLFIQVPGPIADWEKVSYE